MCISVSVYQVKYQQTFLTSFVHVFLDIWTKIRLWAKKLGQSKQSLTIFVCQIAILKLLVEKFVKLKGLRGKVRLVAYTLAKFDDFCAKLQFWSCWSKNSWNWRDYEEKFAYQLTRWPTLTIFVPNCNFEAFRRKTRENSKKKFVKLFTLQRSSAELPSIWRVFSPKV